MKEFTLIQKVKIAQEDGEAIFTRRIKLPEMPHRGTVIRGIANKIPIVIEGIEIEMEPDYNKTILTCRITTITKDTINTVMKDYSNWHRDIPNSWLKHLDGKNLPIDLSIHK